MLVQNPRQTLIGLVAAVCLSLTSSLAADSPAIVHALQPAAWLQQGDTIRVLKVGDVVDAGERIITGDGGRLEVRIGDRFSLQQNTGTEIQLQVDAAIGDQDRPDLLVQVGKSCIEVHRVSGSSHQFVVALGSTMTVTMHNEGKICVLHQDGLSSVNLRQGSVQINHSVDSNIIVLSESGSEFQVESGESYSVLLPEVGQVYELASEGFPLPLVSRQAKPAPADEIVEAATGAEAAASESAVEPAEVEPAVEAITLEATPAAEEVTPAEIPAASGDADSEYVYTVYLFSSRDEEVADEVNQRFNQAGVPSQVFVSESDGTTRYRIVVTGFGSRDAARNFSDSIIGNHGISDTWIGRNRRPAGE